jgi:diadenosine tetraphosphate (Ap4A) HIT family hydrolase
MFVMAVQVCPVFLQHLHVHVLPRKLKVKGFESGQFDVSHDRPERSIAEMSEEASMLRPFFNQ